MYSELKRFYILVTLSPQKSPAVNKQDGVKEIHAVELERENLI